jgi:iron complex transport system ATP-binding protein
VKLQNPLSGKIFLSGRDISGMSPTEMAVRVGFVSTEIIQVNNLSVYDLVGLGRYPYTGWMGKLSANDEIKVREAIGMVGMERLSNKNINQLSDGERQRAMIARTLAQDTGIIVLDEPTAFLDLSNKYETVHLLQNLAGKSGKTIIFSTHDLNIAIQAATKIWLMLEDSIIQGAPEDLVLEGSFGKMFKNSNLLFNTDNGEFRIQRTPGVKIGLRGPETECLWTRNALERIGFGVTGRGVQKAMIIIGNDRGKRVWEITINGNKTHFHSIYHLCNFLTECREIKE